MIRHQLKQFFQNNLRHGEQQRTEFRLFFGAVAVLVQPDYAKVWGADWSPWDGNVQTGVTKAMGAQFGFIKAIDGTLQARYFVENRLRAMDSNLITGSYGWLYRNANVSCVAQAQAYTTLLNKYPVELPPAIDFEPTKWGGVASNPTFTDLRTWATEWLRLGNPKPILYSAAYYMKQYGQMPSDLKDMFAGLWVAHYGTLTPLMPLGFGQKEYLFHQFASNGDAKLLSPNDVNKLEVDLNYFNGSADDLKRLAGQVVIPPPPDNGGSMTTILVNRVARASNGSTQTVRLRSTPDASITTNILTGGLASDDLIVCDLEKVVAGAKWRKIRALVRQGVNVVLPSSPTGEVWASDAADGSLQVELSAFDVAGGADLSVVASLSLVIEGVTYALNNGTLNKVQ